VNRRSSAPSASAGTGAYLSCSGVKPVWAVSAGVTGANAGGWMSDVLVPARAHAFCW
jgi:hypothetical protein